MSNISTSKIASPQLPLGKATATKNSSIAQSSFNNTFNQVKSDNVSKDGSFVLGKNITVTDLISPQEKEMPTFSGQIKMPDGSIANVESVHAKIFTHEQDVELLQQTGMTKAEAEEILKPKDISQLSSKEQTPDASQLSPKEQTPEEYKAYLMSKQVDAVARDTEGNIVAKIYTDGSLMCSNGLADSLVKCSSNAERIHILQKNSNVTISDYTKTKITDFDLLKEEIVLQEKNRLRHPQQFVFKTQEERDFYNTQQEVFEFQKRTLAA